MAIDRADARLFQRIDRRVGVVGCGVAMVPIEQGSCAAVQLVQGAAQIGDTHVVRCEMRHRCRVHKLGVFEHRPVRHGAAHAGLPGVLVTVNEARCYDHARRIDHLSIDRIDVAADLNNLVVLDQHFTAVNVADGAVHRNDPAALDQFAGHGGPP